MKASIKFRDEQKPLFRAKVPLNILGFPFQSGIVAGETKELSLNLSTFFDTGPSLKLAYRPNDSLNPFGLVFKTGIGHFGSPISSSMTMSAEFNLVGNQNPSFFVHFKPQFGDFTLKKSQSSVFVKNSKSKTNGDVSHEDGLVEVFPTPLVNNEPLPENGLFADTGKKITLLPLESPVAGVVKRVFSGTEVSARTAVPLRNRAVVSFRWGVKLPAAEAEETGALVTSDRTAGIPFKKFPLLVMNKIGIEHVVAEDSKGSTDVGPRLNSPGGADVAEACLDVMTQLEVIKAENGLLRKAMEELRSDIVVGNSVLVSGGGAGSGKYREGERGGMKHPGGKKVDRHSNSDKKSSESNGFGGKVAECDVNEELKKALKEATAGA